MVGTLINNINDEVRGIYVVRTLTNNIKDEFR